MDLIPRLSHEFEHRNIVVRPHPSEDHDTYRRKFQGTGNVHVVHEGNVIPWLMAADAVIHNGCTTAVEACLLGRPVICYQPYTSELYDIEFPNAMGVRAGTEDELLSFIRTGFDGAGRRKEQEQQALKKHIHTVETSHSREIVACLAGNWGRVSGARPDQALLMTVRRLALRMRMRMERKAVLGNTDYESQKFDGLRLEEVEGIVRGYERQCDEFGDLLVTQVWQNCFAISKKP
jgi:CDP-glycerol glycerophosphotransferase (TagB/SpsB family)